MELNYGELEKEIVEILEKEQEIVFATSADNIVTARTMCHVNDGLAVMFSTVNTSRKVEQVKKNPNIALVAGALQMEATAELYGSQLKHKAFLEMNNKKFPWMKKDFPTSEVIPDTSMLIICHPTKISLYKFIDGEPHWDILMVTEKKAFRI